MASEVALFLDGWNADRQMLKAETPISKKLEDVPSVNFERRGTAH